MADVLRFVYLAPLFRMALSLLRRFLRLSFESPGVALNHPWFGLATPELHFDRTFRNNQGGFASYVNHRVHQTRYGVVGVGVVGCDLATVARLSPAAAAVPPPGPTHCLAIPPCDSSVMLELITHQWGGDATVIVVGVSRLFH